MRMMIRNNTTLGKLFTYIIKLHAEHEDLHTTKYKVWDLFYSLSGFLVIMIHSLTNLLYIKYVCVLLLLTSYCSKYSMEQKTMFLQNLWSFWLYLFSSILNSSIETILAGLRVGWDIKSKFHYALARLILAIYCVW